MKQIIKISLFFLAGVLAILSFQNCGGGFENIEEFQSQEEYDLAGGSAEVSSLNRQIPAPKIESIYTRSDINSIYVRFNKVRYLGREIRRFNVYYNGEYKGTYIRKSSIERLTIALRNNTFPIGRYVRISIVAIDDNGSYSLADNIPTFYKRPADANTTDKIFHSFEFNKKYIRGSGNDAALMMRNNKVCSVSGSARLIGSTRVMDHYYNMLLDVANKAGSLPPCLDVVPAPVAPQPVSPAPPSGLLGDIDSQMYSDQSFSIVLKKLNNTESCRVAQPKGKVHQDQGIILRRLRDAYLGRDCQ